MLYRGTKGNTVAHLQTYLNQVIPTPPKLRIDGIFGALTYGRLVQFQRKASGLTVDGVYGPRTQARLLAALKRINRQFSERGVAPVTESRGGPQPQAKGPNQMSRKEVETMLRNASKDFDVLVKVMGPSALENFYWYASKSRDAADVLDGWVTLDAVFSSSTRLGLSTAADIAGAFVGFAGIVFFLIDSALEIVRIYKGAEETYAMRSVAYTITAWTFEKPQVAGSSTIASHPSEAESHKAAWLKAQQATLQKLNGTPLIGGVTPARFRKMVQILYRDDAAAYSKDVMKALTPKVPAGPYRTAWESHLGDSSFAVLFPK